MKKYLLLSTALTLISFEIGASEITCPADRTSTSVCWTCGDNCTLSFDSKDGHVTVSGTGDMVSAGSSYMTNFNEWAIYKNQMTSLEIKEGITSIGGGAFAATSITSAILPNGLTKIGDGVFDHANKLKILVLPDSVTSASGQWTFNDTPLLTNVICSGGGKIEKCQRILNRNLISSPSYLLDENGEVIEKYGYDKNGQRYLLTADGELSIKQSDGSSYIYNKDGKLVSIRGKKIYTVEEAEAVTAHGDKFHVSLTYK